MSHAAAATAPISDVIHQEAVAPKETTRLKPKPRAASRWSRTPLWMLLCVVAFGAGWMFAGGGQKPHPKVDLPPAAEPVSEAVSVTVEPIVRRAVQRSVQATGTLAALEGITISAKVEGRVRRLHADVADRIKPGAILLEIEPTDYILAVEQAERALDVELAKLGLEKRPQGAVDLENVPVVTQARTRMENSQARYERARRLASSRTISTEELDAATSDFRAAEAEHANQMLVAKAALATARMKETALAVARQQLSDATVLAPIPSSLSANSSGNASYAVTQRAVAEGTLVRPGAELFKLVVDRTLKLRLPVPERYATEIRKGQKADVQASARPGSVAGTVMRINPAVDSETRTFQVEIEVPNSAGELKAGGFAKAAILTKLDTNAAAVPLAAVVSFAGVDKIFLVKDGRASEVRVTLGAESTDWVEIMTPALPADARVITSGQALLAESTPIAVRDHSGEKGASEKPTIAATAE